MIWSTIAARLVRYVPCGRSRTRPTTTFLCVERGRDSWQDKKDLGVGDDGDPSEVPSSQAVLGRGRERIPRGVTTGRGVDRRYCCRVAV
jgi:hypothetical protein